MEKNRNLVLILALLFISLNIYSKSTKPEILWKKKIGINSWRNNSIFNGDNIYIGSSGKYWNKSDFSDGVYCLDITTGAKKWFFRSSIDFNSISYFSNAIIGGNDFGEFFSIDALSGEKNWKIQLDGAVYGKAIESRNGLIIATGKGHLYLIDSFTGEIKVKTQVEGGVRAGLSLDNDIIYVATEYGNLYKFSSDNLSLIKVKQLYYPDKYGRKVPLKELSKEHMNYSSTFSRAKLYSEPLIINGLTYMGFIRQTSYKYPAIQALDKDLGLLWYGSDVSNKLKDSFGNIRFKPAIYNDLIILGNPYSNTIYSVSAKTGKVVWVEKMGQKMFQHWSSPLVIKDSIYIARHDGFFHKLDAKTGKRLWSIFLGSSEKNYTYFKENTIPGEELYAEWNPKDYAIFSTASYSDGYIGIGTEEGYFYLIKEKTRY